MAAAAAAVAVAAGETEVAGKVEGWRPEAVTVAAAGVKEVAGKAEGQRPEAAVAAAGARATGLVGAAGTAWTWAASLAVGSVEEVVATGWAGVRAEPARPAARLESR